MFLKSMEKELVKGKTTNGAIVYNTSMDSIVDLFAKIGAMREASEAEKVKAFAEAYNTDRLLALKVLFYARDIRGGQGERDTFRQMFNYVINADEPTAIANMQNIVEFGRWDDLLTLAMFNEDSRFADQALSLVKRQIMEDLTNLQKGEPISLLGKWMWSINASSKETKAKAHWLKKKLGMSSANYRKILSKLRAKINIVETIISEKRYEDLEYDKVPSLAMTKYRQSFYRNDLDGITNYIDLVKSGEKKINASTLYPYDLVRPVLEYRYYEGNEQQAQMDILDAQWNALPNYIGDREWNGLVVADVSGSMSGLPMEVSISLAMYISERNNGYFKDNFITFSERPKLQKVKGASIFEKVRNLHSADWGYNTDLEAVFNLILNTAVSNNLTNDDIPNQLFIITDMQFNADSAEVSDTSTFMQRIGKKYAEKGYNLPKLVWWNVNARYGNSFPMTVDEAGVQYVSGCSPVILKTLLAGEHLTPIGVVENTVCIPRYDRVIVL